jgi:hypothetical protein
MLSGISAECRDGGNTWVVCLLVFATVLSTFTGLAVEVYWCLNERPSNKAAKWRSIETVPFRAGHLKHFQK